MVGLVCKVDFIREFLKNYVWTSYACALRSAHIDFLIMMMAVNVNRMIKCVVHSIANTQHMTLVTIAAYYMQFT